MIMTGYNCIDIYLTKPILLLADGLSFGRFEMVEKGNLTNVHGWK